MRLDLISGTTNVIRFPVERRAPATLELLREIAPDLRDALYTGEAFGLPMPDPDLRHAVDAQTAEYILNNIRHERSPERQESLSALLVAAVTPAVFACRAAHDAAVAADAAQERVIDARIKGDSWLPGLEERADRLVMEAAQRFIEAHTRREEAEGVARAIGIAMSGETWAPFDLEAEAEALFFGKPAKRAR